MIEEIKILLGKTASNYTEAQIGLALKRAIADIEGYCKRELDYELEGVAVDMAIVRLNRMNTEGLASQSYSGVSESYINGYPDNIMKILNRKRKIKVV